jgi:hypothetical protein
VLQLAVDTLALLDFSADVLLHRQALPALALDGLFELPDLVLVRVRFAGQGGVDRLQIPVFLF